MTDNKSSEGKKTISAGTVIFIADVSDALKVLKAVQGEARKSTTALKSSRKSICLLRDNYPLNLEGTSTLGHDK